MFYMFIDASNAQRLAIQIICFYMCFLRKYSIAPYISLCVLEPMPKWDQANLLLVTFERLRQNCNSFSVLASVSSFYLEYTTI